MTRTSGGVSAICLAKFQVLTTGKLPVFPNVLVASDFASLHAQHLQLTGTIGQTVWVCSVNDTGTLLPLLLPRSQILPLTLSTSRGRRHQKIPSFRGLRADCFRPKEPVFSDIKPGVPTHGWQFFAARTIEEHFVSSSVLPKLSPTESALYVHNLDLALGGAFLLFRSVLPPALPCSPPSSLVASPPPVLSHLPVWPSTRRFWPSPCSVLEGGGSWKSWVCV